ncbi:YdeI/OmpD-associated family protein [Gemmatimonas groenlandica]|uniref:YdeI/OmpD-associated family protein n=1 Tax=Gemmatimonas groenlandica TaxID=2732249 RepID=A0A6M4IU37_9BACT|nr:YdeI/OmpD-associated family protein [Gemmatimonas groenlandica]QJR37648.1 YdeI/OmpD-associated family protein [Gemmatimonas groenlandica]
MSYFTHRFETRIARHAVGTYHYTVVYLDASLHSALPLEQHARLRIEADVSGVPVKGAWQPARGRWYLMLPKAPMKAAGLKIGSPVEVAFRVLPQDDVDIPDELAALLATKARVRKAWAALSPGKQRGIAHLVSSAKRPETKAARIQSIEAGLLGTAAPPWERPGGRASAATGE